MAQIDLAGTHQCADCRGAHARQCLVLHGFLKHKAVGAEQRLFQKGLFLAGQTLGSILLLKAALNDIACALAGFPSAACTAHAIADQKPCGIAGQPACAVIILIILTDTSDICFSCKFHRILPLLCLPVHFIPAQLTAGSADLAAKAAAHRRVDAKALQLLLKAVHICCVSG